MKPRRTSDSSRVSKAIQGDGPNWILIAGSALLSTLSIRLGYKLKQVFDAKEPNTCSQSPKVNRKSPEWKNSGSCHLHSNAICFPHDEDGYYNHYSGPRTAVEIKPHLNGQISESEEMSLPLVTIPASELNNKENGVMWSASPDQLEHPHKPFHQSNSSGSESGSDIFRKREVIQKLRQQLKRRDDMILEMQDQITDLQNSLSVHLSHSSHLQFLLDAANGDLFESEREIQRLRKAISDHCVGRAEGLDEKTPSVLGWSCDFENWVQKQVFRCGEQSGVCGKKRGDVEEEG